ncbi:MAG: hypothetical protein M3335_03540 [Actinomycetota bacterium]|nr:hypothetical protein [Actinomycetota bacterium]
MAGLVACGGGGDASGEVEDTAIAFVEAVDKEDSEETCAMLSKEVADIFEGDGELSCEEFFIPNLEAGPLRFPEVKKTKVDGTDAEVEVEVSGGEEVIVELVEEGEEWKVSEFLLR